ncbi:hypothetical protein GCM10010973_32480 [Cribrihabitans marinus]|nr:hypothetical protein GCM10010973_32480 [Cribrihabitans marinus]
MIKSFMPDQLLGRDVVKDFADLIGVAPLADDQIIRTNESLSLEAVALLYVQRKLGRGFVAGFDGAHSANNAYISRLATIGHRKFCFSPQMLAPLLEAERDDIAWMEDRLGQPFSDVGAAHPEAISSLDELVDVALQQFDAVQELLGDKAVTQGPTTPETLVQALEQLREGCYEEVSAVAPRQVKATSQFLTGKGAKSMPSETVRSKATEEELRLRTKLARILWHNDHLTDMPSDPEERKVAFGNVAKDYQRKALDLTRRLERNNLKLVELETQD